MINTMGIIYTTKDDLTLREMTASRAVAALPVAGRYRMIDFVLSNMVNSGVRNVGVIMQKNYHSLMDHLGSGKEWDLHTRNDGLRILPPFLTRENVGEYSGNIDALRSNAGFLRRSRQEYVILSASHTVFNVIPAGVTVTVDEAAHTVAVKGPKGIKKQSLSLPLSKKTLD